MVSVHKFWALAHENRAFQGAPVGWGASSWHHQLHSSPGAVPYTRNGRMEPSCPLNCSLQFRITRTCEDKQWDQVRLNLSTSLVQVHNRFSSVFFLETHVAQAPRSNVSNRIPCSIILTSSVKCCLTLPGRITSFLFWVFTYYVVMQLSGSSLR